MISGKNILIGVTGSIAIYKSLELIREFIKSGANIKVVMSSSATKFISELTFEALSRNRVLLDSNQSWADDHNHIDIGKWADLFIIAPATINTINKLHHGISDNVLLEVAFAYGGTILLAPAANTNMYQHVTTTSSINRLKMSNYKIIEPDEKLLACGDEGVGALARVSDIYHASIRELLKDKFWVDRKVVISGGGTIDKIDDVRFISNFSSGKMASSLALALYYKGANVCLISSKFPLDLPSQLESYEVTTSKEFKDKLSDSIEVLNQTDDFVSTTAQKKPYLFMVAAIGDYIPKYPKSGKLKKDQIGSSWSLELIKNEDILLGLDKDNISVIGFKAEMDEVSGLESAKKMLQQKSLDAVCLNYLGHNSFGSSNNSITLITKNTVMQLEQNSKLNISFELIQSVKDI
jgi:phosphopantothenoylcysteine decarboxylase/phosphopantothenate--cysteine ligase